MNRKITAYQTTAAIAYQNSIDKAISDLKVSFIKNHTPKHEESGIYLVTGFGSTASIASFNHPVTFEIEGQVRTFVDVRTCIKLDQHSLSESSYIVRDVDEFSFNIYRSQIQHLWATDMPTILRDFSTLPISAFANLISEHTTRRLALDPRDTLVVTVLSGVLYLNLFKDTIDADDSKVTAVQMSNKLSVNLSIKQQLIYEIIMNHTGISNVDELCVACQEVSNSVRLRDLNHVTLFGIVGPNWYGYNGRELMSVALEHPPTWISLIYRALNSRGYNNSGLSKFMERGIFKKLSLNFNSQFKQLIQRDVNH